MDIASTLQFETFNHIPPGLKAHGFASGQLQCADRGIHIPEYKRLIADDPLSATVRKHVAVSADAAFSHENRALRKPGPPINIVLRQQFRENIGSRLNMKPSVLVILSRKPHRTFHRSAVETEHGVLQRYRNIACRTERVSGGKHVDERTGNVHISEKSVFSVKFKSARQLFRRAGAGSRAGADDIHRICRRHRDRFFELQT